jgi:serine-type D-Ala-D-Ala carboxypeptidase (penicillin-binding protein 5/6)
VVLAVLGDPASGTTTTLSTASAALPEDSLPEGSETGTQGTIAGDLEPVFIVRASDLGDFSADPPSLSSPAAVVVSMSTGRVLYAKKAETRKPMASTTKIMTAVLCLESLSLDQEVTISQTAAATSEVKTFLQQGDVLTVEQLLYSLLVHSSNAAAVALAETQAGSVEAFAERMNEKAAELVMEDTHFINPNGLDATGHYSTASDMAKLGIYAMRNAEFRKLVSTKTYELNIPARSKTLTFENTNKLMLRASWVTGVKTGLTPQADQCLVAAGTKNGVSVLSVILGQPSTSVCWDESEALLKYGLKQYRHVTFLNDAVAVAEAEVPYRLDGKIRLVTERSLEMDVYKDDEVAATVRLDRQLTLPVQAGETFGQVVLTADGKEVGSVDLVADKSYSQTTLGGKINYFWDRFARWLGGVM